MKTSTDFGDLKSNGSDGYSDETREYEVIASQPENEVECIDDELDRATSHPLACLSQVYPVVAGESCANCGHLKQKLKSAESICWWLKLAVLFCIAAIFIALAVQVVWSPSTTLQNDSPVNGDSMHDEFKHLRKVIYRMESSIDSIHAAGRVGSAPQMGNSSSLANAVAVVSLIVLPLFGWLGILLHRLACGHLTKERDRVEHEKAELQARIATVTEQQSNDAGVHEPAGETGAELERERVELGEKVDDFHVVSSAIRNQLDTMHKVVLSADSAGLAELASAIQESTCVLKESQEEMDQLVDSELAQAGWKCARAKVISNGGNKLREELKAYTIMTEWDKDITQLRSEKDALDLKHAELASVLTGLQTLMTAGKASLEFHADVAELEAAGEEEVTTTTPYIDGLTKSFSDLRVNHKDGWIEWVHSWVGDDGSDSRVELEASGEIRHRFAGTDGNDWRENFSLPRQIYNEKSAEQMANGTLLPHRFYINRQYIDGGALDLCVDLQVHNINFVSASHEDSDNRGEAGDYTAPVANAFGGFGSFADIVGSSTSPTQVCYNCGNEGHRAQQCTSANTPQEEGTGSFGRKKPAVFTCFHCKWPGHKAKNCPNNSKKMNRYHFS